MNVALKRIKWELNFNGYVLWPYKLTGNSSFYYQEIFRWAYNNAFNEAYI